ncbi:helix-turn-helix domain-containing protein [Kitasatospora sp. CB02891]|uniref:winged helix-turn-helix domain-containing protein n=1 Tax=Kitasatospora sp. CB02891 TaxID=2020329 RepID=UPI000C275DE4|nr:helix-turn-helix domain-containing protein [Kitasatospora sp. CB02891]PJN26846.1 transcriptional regulator [Kitasatospora sp. CB02891]
MNEHRPDEHPATPAPEGEHPRRRLDANSLRGLAHPLRMRLLDELRLHGPSTSARLADRTGESTGTISWHLRHLAEHGFIEEEAGRGTKRERWWRAMPGAISLSATDFEQDPGAKAAVSVYQAENLRRQYQRVADSLAAEWEGDWRSVGFVSDWSNLRLTPDQLRALSDELAAVVARHTPDPAAAPDPDARPAIVQIQVLPRKEPDRP